MKAVQDITEELSEIAAEYNFDKELAVKNIGKILLVNHFENQGGEMRGVERYTRDNYTAIDEIIITYEDDNCGISYHQYCKKCSCVIDALGDDIDVCECK